MELEPGYKQTEVGVIPENWEIRACEELCLKIQDGTHFSPKTGGNDYFYVTSRNIGFGNLNLSTAERIDTAQHRGIYERCDVQKGDVLLTKDGANTGNAALNPLDEEFSLLSSVALLRFDPERNSSEYFLQQILSGPGQRQIKEAMSGNAITRLTLQKIKNLRFLTPPLSEQRAIAKAMGDVDALLDALDQLITKKRDLKQATMQQLLTAQTRLPGFCGKWEVTQLCKIAEIIVGQSPPSSYYNNKGEGLPLIQGNADIEDRKTIRRVYTSEITKRGRYGDILVSVRAPVGEISRVMFDVCLGRGVNGLRYTNDFLYYAMVAKEPSWKKLSKGSTFDSVTSTDVKAFEVDLPVDEAEQIAIAEVLSNMDAELTTLEHRRNKTRAIKQGMMQELLTGRIRLIETDANVIPFPERKDRTITQKKHNPQFNEAVVIAALSHRFGTEKWPLSRFKYTKFAYLLHRHAEHVAEGYLKKAAGPYNPRTRYGGAEKIAKEKLYVRTHNNGKYQGFVADKNISEANDYFQRWYGADELAWLEQFRYTKHDELELLTTVDMALECLRQDGKSKDFAAVKQLIHDEPEWLAKLDRSIFADDKIKSAIANANQLFGNDGD